MTALCLLFDQSCEYLGDVFVIEGAFSRAALTNEGEERMGGDVASWKTKGIPVRAEAFGAPDRPRDIIFGKERVKAQDRRFGAALRQWADDRHFLVLSLRHEAVRCWEMLIRLPFEGAERFALALALSKATRPQLERWDRGLRTALDVQE